MLWVTLGPMNCLVVLQVQEVLPSSLGGRLITTHDEVEAVAAELAKGFCCSFEACSA
jgi:hypothetical protein